jgi:hypothetical protein
MPDLDQKLWGEAPQWPAAPLNFVFVVDAIQRLGRAKYRGAWPTIVVKQGKEFDVILETLGKACEAGTVDAFYEWGVGSLDQVKRTDWHVPNWRSFFYRGWLYATEEYEAETDSFAAIEAGLPPPQTKPCWIFVRTAGLAQLEARLKASSRSKEGAKPIKASKRSPAAIKLRDPGRIPQAQRDVMAKIDAAVKNKELTKDGLSEMKQEEMARKFGHARATCNEARKRWLCQF